MNCRNCLNFNPFAKQFYERKWEKLVDDIDVFFSCIDRIMLFHLSGGEPLLYPFTADLVLYIDKNYGDRIDTLRTVTNGTVIPKDEVLEKLSMCRFELTVDDYREAIPNSAGRFEELLLKLEKYNIRYYINHVEEWIDLAPDKTDYSKLSEKAMIEHRDSCSQSWQELRDGKLYSCNYAAYAAVAGIAGEMDVEETFNLREFNSDKRRELVEFRLGYTEKGYTNFCRKCRGFTADNNLKVPVAAQVKRNESLNISNSTF